MGRRVEWRQRDIADNGHQHCKRPDKRDFDRKGNTYRLKRLSQHPEGINYPFAPPNAQEVVHMDRQCHQYRDRYYTVVK